MALRLEKKYAFLVLENAHSFPGFLIGENDAYKAEVVFNTSLTGYQEVVSDPSYLGQMVVFTTSHLGNVGINAEDFESKKLWLEAIIVRSLADYVSNWRSDSSLDEIFAQSGKAIFSDADVRSITRTLRSEGALKGIIKAFPHKAIGSLLSKEEIQLCLDELQDLPDLHGADLAVKATAQTSYTYHPAHNHNAYNPYLNLVKRSDQDSSHLVVYDFGIKSNILSLLFSCVSDKITVVPATTSFEALLALKPDAVVLSNGPGDPNACGYAIDLAKHLIENRIPTLGICLGFQILCLAAGASSYKMKFGHHGTNHPVQDMRSKQVFITSQNHSFAIDDATLPDNLQPIYRSLFDGSLQGVEGKEIPLLGFQGHPEAGPGPHDINSIFTDFYEMIKVLKD